MKRKNGTMRAYCDILIALAEDGTERVERGRGEERRTTARRGGKKETISENTQILSNAVYISGKGIDRFESILAAKLIRSTDACFYT
jgi:hypothetical protein